MDIMTIIFLVFGWIFDVTGLKITALAMSAIFFGLIAICGFFGKKGENKKSQTVNAAVWGSVLALSIVSLVI